jgi:hypothetical protein
VNIAFKPVVKLNENGVGNRMNFDKTCWETHLGRRAEIWPSEGESERKIAKMSERMTQNITSG